MVTQQEILDVLRRARERIADPARWCQHALAEDADGERVEPTSSGAIRWCAVGALQCEEERSGYLGPAVNGGYGFLVSAALFWAGATATEVNDERGHAAVLELYDRAIADAEAAVSA